MGAVQRLSQAIGALRAYLLAPFALVVLAGIKLFPGLDPASLFLDDQWVAIALREADLLERIGLHLPAPIGFTALAGLPGAFVGDPEVALQVLPVLAYLGAIALFPLVVHRLSGNAWAATLGTAMLASAPLTAAFAVRVKHYTLDLLVTTALLLLMVNVFRTRSPRRVLWMSCVLMVAVVFSFASVFLATCVLLVAGAAVWGAERPGGEERTRIALITSGSLAAIGAFFVLFVRKASRPVMVDFWSDFFPTFDGGQGVWRFVSQRTLPFLSYAMPEWAWVLVLLVPLGFAWLWRSGHRHYGLVLAGFYASVVTASVARAYPMGTGRTDIFALPVTTLLICLGVASVLEQIRGEFVRRGLYAGLTLLFAASTLWSPGAQYPSTDDRGAVEWVLERMDESDALVLSPYAAFAFEWYADGPSALTRADFYGHGFDVVSARPFTHTTAIGRWDLAVRDGVGAEVSLLADFVEDAPARVIYLETYGIPDGRGLILSTIADRGYRLVERTDFGRVAEAFIFEPAGGGA